MLIDRLTLNFTDRHIIFSIKAYYKLIQCHVNVAELIIIIAYPLLERSIAASVEMAQSSMKTIVRELILSTSFMMISLVSKFGYLPRNCMAEDCMRSEVI